MDDDKEYGGVAPACQLISGHGLRDLANPLLEVVESIYEKIGESHGKALKLMEAKRF